MRCRYALSYMIVWTFLMRSSLYYEFYGYKDLEQIIAFGYMLYWDAHFLVTLNQ